MRGKGLGRALTGSDLRAGARARHREDGRADDDRPEGRDRDVRGAGLPAEALLRDHVKDRNGEKHDLLVYSHDVREFQSQMDAYGMSEAARRLATYPQRGSNSIGISSAVLPMSSRATSFVVGGMGRAVRRGRTAASDGGGRCRARRPCPSPGRRYGLRRVRRDVLRHDDAGQVARSRKPPASRVLAAVCRTTARAAASSTSISAA